MGNFNNVKYGKEFIERVKNMLEQGASTKFIVSKLNIPYTSLINLVRRNKLKLNLHARQICVLYLKKEINNIEKLFKNGMSINKIAKKYSVSSHTMKYFIIQNNIIKSTEVKIKELHFDVYDFILKYQKIGIEKVSAQIICENLNLDYHTLKSIFRTCGARQNFMDIMAKKVRHPDLFTRVNEINLEEKKDLITKNVCEKSEIEAIKARVENLEMQIEILTETIKELMLCQTK